jgi:hypothetical protein
MTAIIIDIMAEVLTILGIVTKEVKRGGLSELMSGRFTILTDTLLRKVFEEIDGKYGHRG